MAEGNERRQSTNSSGSQNSSALNYMIQFPTIHDTSSAIQHEAHPFTASDARHLQQRLSIRNSGRYGSTYGADVDRAATATPETADYRGFTPTSPPGDNDERSDGAHSPSSSSRWRLPGHSRDSGGFPTPDATRQQSPTSTARSGRGMGGESQTMLPMYLDDQAALSSPCPPTATSGAPLDTQDSAADSTVGSTTKDQKGKSIASSREALIGGRDYNRDPGSPQVWQSAQAGLNPPPHSPLNYTPEGGTPSARLSDTEESARISPAQDTGRTTAHDTARDSDAPTERGYDLAGVYSSAFSPLFSPRDAAGANDELSRAGPSRVMFGGQDSIFTQQSIAQGDTLAVAFLYNMQLDVPEEHWPDTYRAFTTIFNEYSLGKVSLPGVCKRALRLFQHYPQLTDEFFMALPYAGFSEYWIGSKDYNVLQHTPDGVPAMLDGTPRGGAAGPSPLMWTGETPRVEILVSQLSTPTQNVSHVIDTIEEVRSGMERSMDLPDNGTDEANGAPNAETMPEIALQLDTGDTAKMESAPLRVGDSGTEYGAKATPVLATSSATTAPHYQSQLDPGSVQLTRRDLQRLQTRERVREAAVLGGSQLATEPPLNEMRIAEIRRKLEQQGIDNGQFFRDWRDVSKWRDISNWLVPKGRGRYINWFTTVLSGVFALLFFIMAGQQNMVDAQEADPEQDVLRTGPYALTQWITLSPSTEQSFQFKVLLDWGGRYGPCLANGQWWRLFSSLVLHQNAVHLIANWVLLFVLGVHLEFNYATWRIILVWILAGLGGNLASAAFEDQCTLVVGSSGAMFGLFGFFVADLVLNFESISYPILRLLLVLVFLTFFLVTTLSGGQGSNSTDSHWSHIGGLLTGFFSSFIFLPNLKDARWRMLRESVTRMLAEPVRQLTALPTRSRDHDYYNTQSLAHTEINTAPYRQTRSTIVRENQRHRQRILAAVDDHKSVWSRFLVLKVNPFFLLAVAILLLAYVVLPLYIFNWRLKNLDCGALSGC